jgi:hypothetical protein
MTEHIVSGPHGCGGTPPIPEAAILRYLWSQGAVAESIPTPIHSTHAHSSVRLHPFVMALPPIEHTAAATIPTDSNASSRPCRLPVKGPLGRSADVGRGPASGPSAAPPVAG